MNHQRSFMMSNSWSRNAIHLAAVALAAGFGAQQAFALNDGVAKLPGKNANPEIER